MDGRYASLAQVLSIPLGAVAVLIGWIQLRALRQEQQRLADELSRQPAFNIGFGPYRTGSITVDVTQSAADPSLTEPVELSVCVLNTGRRSATQVSITCTLPLTFAGAASKHRVHQRTSDLTGMVWAFIHPGTQHYLPVPIRCPWTDSAVLYKMSVSMTCIEVERATRRLI